MSVADREHPADAFDASEDGIVGGRIRRTAPLVGLTARTAGEAVVLGLRTRLTDSDRADAYRADFHVQAAERYAQLLGRSKGALMKAGQLLSLSAATFAVPEEFRSVYEAALSCLRDDAPPMPPRLARSVLEHEFGCRAECAFAEFDWQPFAAASIGQVHAARLHDGREVAVKIQYPGVAEAIVADLKNAELLATFISLIAGGFSSQRLSLDIRGAARELTTRIAEELDYRLEAANQAEFASHYRGHPFIHVPDVVLGLCTDRVLVQELVRGLSFDEALTAEQGLRDQWAEGIYRFVYGMYKRYGLFNADPHPGNYMFHENGSVSCFDFGCIKRFRRDQVQAMDAVVSECFRNNVRGTWRACVEAGFFRSTDPVTPEEVFEFWRRDWAMLWAQRPFTITPEYVAKRIERRCSPSGPSANALRHFAMDPDYILMGRIELGVAVTIAPLRPRVHWGSIAAEEFDGALPLTELGKREHAFRERSGSGQRL